MQTYCPKHDTGCGPCYCHPHSNLAPYIIKYHPAHDITLIEAALRTPALFPHDYPRILFDMAHQIAHAAACLDGLLNNQAAEDRAAAPAHLAALHRIAAQLAGDRAGEIYPPEETAELKIEETA